MCHPFSSMFHHLTCLGTCWKPAPGSGCWGVGGMDGDATTPGGFERRGTFFLPWGTNRPCFFFWDFNEENLWKPIWKPMKTLRQRKEHGGFQAKLMKNEHKQCRKWSIGRYGQPPGFFSSTDGLGHLNLGEVWHSECREFAGYKMFQEKQTNKQIQSDWLERSRKIIWKI